MKYELLLTGQDECYAVDVRSASWRVDAGVEAEGLCEVMCVVGDGSWEAGHVPYMSVCVVLSFPVRIKPSLNQLIPVCNIVLFLLKVSSNNVQ